MALIPVGDTEKQDSRPVDTWQRRLYDDLHVSLYFISIPVCGGKELLFNFVSYLVVEFLYPSLNISSSTTSSIQITRL